MILRYGITCPECDADIIATQLFVGDDPDAFVNVLDFEQSDWHCLACGKDWAIGDIMIDDAEDL